MNNINSKLMTHVIGFFGFGGFKGDVVQRVKKCNTMSEVYEALDYDHKCVRDILNRLGCKNPTNEKIAYVELGILADTDFTYESRSFQKDDPEFASVLVKLEHFLNFN